MYIISLGIPFPVHDQIADQPVETMYYGWKLHLMGLLGCWHPLYIAWWANVMFLAAWRNLSRGDATTGFGFSLGGALLALSYAPFAKYTWFYLPTSSLSYLCYGCWLGSMVLMLIAASVYLHHVKATYDKSASMPTLELPPLRRRR